MNNNILHEIELDVIALETKHQEDYEQSQLIQEFADNYQDCPRITFSDGKYDGELDIEPKAYQWFNPIYRSGYLTGIIVR